MGFFGVKENFKRSVHSHVGFTLKEEVIILKSTYDFVIIKTFIIIK